MWYHLFIRDRTGWGYWDTYKNLELAEKVAAKRMTEMGCLRTRIIPSESSHVPKYPGD